LNIFELNKIAAAVIVSALVIMGINQVGHMMFKQEPAEHAAPAAAPAAEETAAMSEEAAAPAEEAVAAAEEAAAPAEEAAPEAAAPTAPATASAEATPAAEAPTAPTAAPVPAAPAAVPAAAGSALAALLAQAKPEDGVKVFRKCSACHTAEAGAPNRTGPNLYNTVGRPVAGHAGFNYSDAMKSHGGTWTFEALDAYLENPKDAIPGNKMSFIGLKKPTDRAAVIVYLNSKSDNPLPLPAAP
jgi:cytochrome c